MKTIWKYLVPMTVAVIALASCNIEIDLANQEQSNKTLHITVKASAEDIKGKADTKTYIDSDGRTIHWGTDEYMKLALTAGENTVFDNSNDTSADVWEGSDEAIFEFEVSPGEASSYIYQGIYPASAAVAESNENPAEYKVLLPATQNATVSSYDPAAYIMVAKPESFNTIQSEWEAWFLRATALNKITLKNVPDGVSIKRVKITAPTGKYLAGARTIDLTSDADKSTVMGSIYDGTETVEVKYATALSGTNVDVWFTSWDVTVASGEELGIEVYTVNNQLYSRTLTARSEGIKFQEGHLNTLGVSLKDITPTASTTVEDGEYVILAKNGDGYYAMKAEDDGSNRLVSVDYTGSTSSYYGDADIVWTITNTGEGYTIENDSKYVGYKGTKNEAYWLASNGEWGTGGYSLKIVKNEQIWKIKYGDNRYLSRNTSNEYFAFYGNTNQYEEIVLVPATVDNRGTVTLSFKDDEENVTNAVNLTTAECDAFLGLDLVVSPDNVPAITSNITWTYEDNDGVIYEFDDGTLTLTGDPGTATVSASFDGDEYYRPAEASYTITVSSAAGPQYELVSAANEVVSGDYIITWNNTYYLPSGSTSGTNPAVGTGITVANNKITNTVTSDMVWTFTGDNTNGFTISDGTNILHSTNAAQGISITKDSKRKWTVSVDNDYGMLLNGDDGGTRNLAVYNNATWRYYETGNSYSGTLRLYKFVDNTVWDLKSIAVTTEPTKTAYEDGDYFDPTGMVVTATYEDHDGVKSDKTETIAHGDLTFSPALDEALVAGTTSVSITYGDQSTTQAITVSAPITWDLKSIAVTTAPSKTTYAEGECFNPAGMVVTATYENHDNIEQTKPVVLDNNDLTFSPTISTALTTSDASITITYNGKSTTQAITVNAAVHYQKVTSLSNVTAGEYIIVSNNAYLPNASTSSAPAAVAVSIENNEVQNVSSAMTWTFTGTTSKMTIKSTVSGTPYLYTTASNNGVRVGNTSGTWTIAVNNSGFSLKFNDTNRYCATTNNNGGDWRSYDSATSSYYLDGGQVYLYKLVDNTVWDLESIAVTTPPTKTTYDVGDNFDPTGMVVTATYSDHGGVKPNKTEPLAHGDLTFSPALDAALTAGTTSVSITYSGRSTSQSITVIDWTLNSIAVKTAPTKVTYTAGQNFDPAGLVITATYTAAAQSNKNVDVAYSNETAAAFTFSPTTSTALTTDHSSVSITWGGKNTSQAITVNEAGGSTPLTNPANVKVTAITTSSFTATWSNDANASSYEWMLSTSSTAPASTSDSSVKAYGTSSTATQSSGTWTLNKTSIDPALDGKYYFYVKAIGSGSYTDSGYSSASAIVLTFSLTSNPGGWPTTNSTTATDYTYTLSGTSYTFNLKNVKQNSGYLMLTSTASLGLPAISGYKLVKVVASNSSGCSTSTRVGISSSNSSASYISGGSYQTWSTTSSSYTYDLSNTQAGTMYYMYVTNKNCQITELTLSYLN